VKIELAFEVGQTAYVEPDAKVGKITPIITPKEFNIP